MEEEVEAGWLLRREVVAGEVAWRRGQVVQVEGEVDALCWAVVVEVLPC